VVVRDACELCGTSAEPEVCSVRATTLGSEKVEIDLKECVGCGHCVMVCPSDAIAFELDPEVDVVGSLLAQVEPVTNIA
jgi:dissimilatory sulfite reductase (desulfoviridin) alpha/beta subunit